MYSNYTPLSIFLGGFVTAWMIRLAIGCVQVHDHPCSFFGP